MEVTRTVPGRHAYPADLARYVEAHWPPAHPLRLPSALLYEALSVAFHASLTHEEARPTRFRLLLSPPEELPDAGAPGSGVLRLRFDGDRPFTVNELRRTSPASPFETSLIGAHVVDHSLRIWGIAHSGPAWLAPSWGGRSLVSIWTHDPIVHVTAPGQLAVRCAGKLIGGLERGVLVNTMLDLFESTWLPAAFEREREQVRREFAASMPAPAPAPREIDHALVGRIGQHLLRRAIQLIRSAGHGGMLLIIGSAEGHVPPTVRLKYRFEGDEPARRYRSLLLELLGRVAANASGPKVGWSDFVSDPSPELDRLEGAIFELSRVIANLAAIDGAVVLDKRFTLLGFGAEVSAELPAPRSVSRAHDSEGRTRSPESVEDVGTRHRAAYRFVQDHPAGLAIVVSHDGGVTFVADRDGEVVLWEQSVSP